MAVNLPEAEQDRDAHRTFVLALAGFSFTAVAALAVLDAAVRANLQLPTWFVLLSFLAFLSSFNIQSYKSTRWQNELGTALLEVGTLSLLLALVALILSAPFHSIFKWVASVVTLAAWLVDHLVRLRIAHAYLSEVSDAAKRKGS